jgi:hypothetical protein
MNWPQARKPKVIIGTDGTDGHVVVDGIQLLKK